MSHHPRKRYGQNFLISQHIINKQIDTIAPKQHEHFVEIGAGLGALTKLIAPQCQRLDAIEIDRDLIPHLNKISANTKNTHIHLADALTFDFTQLSTNKLRIIGNLPYNISTPLLFHLFSQAHVITDMYFTLQQEIVTRLAAPPGDGRYGRLSVMAQYYCQIEPLFTIEAHHFHPIPKVMSAMVHLVPHTTLPVQADNKELFQLIVRQAFSQRRKMLRNSLKLFIEPIQLQQLGISPDLRAENLSIADFVNISNVCARNDNPVI